MSLKYRSHHGYYLSKKMRIQKNYGLKRKKMQLTFRGRHQFDLSSCNIYCSTRLVCQTFHRHYMSALLICCRLTKTNFQQTIDRSIDSLETSTTNMMRCAIWYHQHNLKNVKNTHGTALLLDKSNTLPFVFSRFLHCTNSAKSRKASQIKIVYVLR